MGSFSYNIYAIGDVTYAPNPVILCMIAAHTMHINAKGYTLEFDANASDLERWISKDLLNIGDQFMIEYIPVNSPLLN